MASTKPTEEAFQDLAADLAALRDDVAKLSTSISDFIRAQTEATANTVLGAVDSTRQKISDVAGKAQDRMVNVASKAQDRMAGVGMDIESTIERNPLASALIAFMAGMVAGMLSRGRK